MCTMSYYGFSEVLKALLRTRELFERWRATSEGEGAAPSAISPEEREWAATELRNSLRSIEWDLEDLDDTIQIVEKNPAKFRIDATEIMVRRNFIAQTKEEVRVMKLRATGGGKGGAAAAHTTAAGADEDDDRMDTVNLASPTTPAATGHPPAPVHGSSKYARLPNETDSPTKVNVMADSAMGAGTPPGGNEEHAVMLDDFGTEIENAENKLDATMRKMAKVLHMSNGEDAAT